MFKKLMKVFNKKEEVKEVTIVKEVIQCDTVYSKEEWDGMQHDSDLLAYALMNELG